MADITFIGKTILFSRYTYITQKHFPNISHRTLLTHDKRPKPRKKYIKVYLVNYV